MAAVMNAELCALSGGEECAAKFTATLTSPLPPLEIREQAGGKI